MFSIGEKVKTRKATRHGMIPAGQMGTVVEIRSEGIAAGVVVEFLREPEPIIAKLFSKDPSVAEPFRCLFPFTSVAKQITKV